jgi:DNA-binding XRE family transcriptional regulator
VLFYTVSVVAKQLPITEKDLAAIAKRHRIASGKNRAQAARELGVARPSLIHAEDFPEKSFLKLRKRIIEKYSPYKVVGPVYRLEKK